MKIKNVLLNTIYMGSFIIILTIHPLNRSVYAVDTTDEATQEVPELGTPDRRGTGGTRLFEDNSNLTIAQN